MAIKFTQYLRPHGDRKCIEVDLRLPTDREVEELGKEACEQAIRALTSAVNVEHKAAELVDAGWSFEAEVLINGLVSFDCCDEDEQLAMEVCANGPQVLVSVLRLVDNAHERWLERGKPEAIGSRGQWVKKKAPTDREWEGIDPEKNPEEFL